MYLLDELREASSSEQTGPEQNSRGALSAASFVMDQPASEPSLSSLCAMFAVISSGIEIVEKSEDGERPMPPSGALRSLHLASEDRVLYMRNAVDALVVRQALEVGSELPTEPFEGEDLRRPDINEHTFRENLRQAKFFLTEDSFFFI